MYSALGFKINSRIFPVVLMLLKVQVFKGIISLPVPADREFE